MTPYIDLHLEVLGGAMQVPKWVRAFKRLAKDLQLRQDEILEAQRNYLENLKSTARQDFLDYNKMAESFGTWVAPKQKPGRPTRRLDAGKDFDA